MKNTLIALLILISLPFTSNAQNILKLENNTNNDIYASYATYDGSCWVCVGWYKVAKYNTFSINVGNYKGKFFVHGENRVAGMEKNWGDKDMLCIEEGENFNIRCPRETNCKVKKVFSEINSEPSGTTRFIFNP